MSDIDRLAAAMVAAYPACDRRPGFGGGPNPTAIEFVALVDAIVDEIATRVVERIGGAS